MARGRKPLDLRGCKFGRLTPLRSTDKRTHGSVVWLCRCDCGNLTEVACNDLMAQPGDSSTKSCGCLRRETPGRRKNINLRKQVLQLREDGLTYREIGKELGISGCRADQLHKSALRDGMALDAPLVAG
jgi:hypothetical protein